MLIANYNHISHISVRNCGENNNVLGSIDSSDFEAKSNSNMFNETFNNGFMHAMAKNSIKLMVLENRKIQFVF